MLTPSTDRPVHVVGAGPGGLATAAALQSHGVRALVIERAQTAGASWRARPDSLRLHTTRRRSALPGLRIPRAAGRWPSAPALADYLERYVEHHGLEIATGVAVSRVDRADPGDPGAGWLLRANGGRLLHAPTVVLATGRHATPFVPDWPGLDGFPGEVLHSAHYRDAGRYKGLDVLVVGAGNSGAETALDLVRGGAAAVRLAVRTPPHVMRRATLGWPAQYSAVMLRRAPALLGDGLTWATRRLTGPDLTGQGLPGPDAGRFTRARQGAFPVLVPGFVRAVRRGWIRPVAAVESFDGPRVRLADGSHLAPDVIVAATGYHSGLAELVGHLGVLDEYERPLAHGARTAPGAPHLHFTGQTNPLSGTLRELALDAERVARAVSRAHRRRSGGRAAPAESAPEATTATRG
ncbi:NAD(P)/FAD-dependent oxidoreductase [Streptomyces durbertensis]|uniref:NAD(P)/FAD-dependent oxidoreductase n=1 Tax=Streptomyces durbertensis TaxID=2448886 RepID=A0ABR6EGT0_9ACTN|nr:NAD(P)/FAD-dependent oxidoreductase [Streptomyces durbertensis]MBB1244540.1 NAD(P)/FAD-dependent oxidoreductase [Streptomyces durbertensis]